MLYFVCVILCFVIVLLVLLIVVCVRVVLFVLFVSGFGPLGAKATGPQLGPGLSNTPEMQEICLSLQICVSLSSSS